MGEALRVWQENWGYVFQDSALLTLALTHPSCVQGSGLPSYQRLEFLGDRVGGLVVAAMLMEAFPEVDEGELARRHAALVCTERMADVARLWEVPPLILLGSGEEAAGGREKPGILADIVEALLGAVFLDGGLSAAESLIRRVWGPLLPLYDGRDAKTLLQELLQAKGLPLPVYETICEEGPAHARVFRVKVVTPWGEAEGDGGSKQKASTRAAENVLKLKDSE